MSAVLPVWRGQGHYLWRCVRRCMSGFVYLLEALFSCSSRTLRDANIERRLDRAPQTSSKLWVRMPPMPVFGGCFFRGVARRYDQLRGATINPPTG